MKRFVFGLVILLWATHVGAADRIRIGYSSISGAYTPIWVAHDAGYFVREGLQDDIILIPSGTQLAQVTVAGEIDIGSLNGSSAIAAALQGFDLKIIGNSGNKMFFLCLSGLSSKRLMHSGGKRSASRVSAQPPIFPSATHSGSTT